MAVLLGTRRSRVLRYAAQYNKGCSHNAVYTACTSVMSRKPTSGEGSCRRLSSNRCCATSSAAVKNRMAEVKAAYCQRYAAVVPRRASSSRRRRHGDPRCSIAAVLALLLLSRRYASFKCGSPKVRSAALGARIKLLWGRSGQVVQNAWCALRKARYVNKAKARRQSPKAYAVAQTAFRHKGKEPVQNAVP